MDLNVLLWQLQLTNQELRDFNSLITLHLNNLSQLVILDNVTVTSKILLQDLQDLLQVVLARNSLHRGKSLTTVTLLDTDVDVVCWLSFGITSVGERIWRLVIRFW